MHQYFAINAKQKDIRNYIIESNVWTNRKNIRITKADDKKVYAKCIVEQCPYRMCYNRNIKENAWCLGKNVEEHNHVLLKFKTVHVNEIGRKMIEVSLENLEMVNHEIVVSKPSGYCGFHCVARFVYQNEDKHLEVKKKMLQQLLENRDIYRQLK